MSVLIMRIERPMMRIPELRHALKRHLLMTHSVLAVNMDIVVAHTPLASRNPLGKVEVLAFLWVAAGGAAHLAALVKSGGAVRRRGCR